MGSARETAVLTLAACEKQGAWSDGYLKRAIREQGLDRRDGALATCKINCCWTGGWPRCVP